jgi:hypothetical protein
MISTLYCRVLPQHPGPERRLGTGQIDFQVAREVQQFLRPEPGLGQRRRQLLRGELVPYPGHLRLALREAARLGVAPDQLGDRGMLAGRGVRLDPIPGADRAQQLIVGGAGVAVVIPGLAIGEPHQRGAAGGAVQQRAAGELGGGDLPGSGDQLVELRAIQARWRRVVGVLVQLGVIRLLLIGQRFGAGLPSRVIHPVRARRRRPPADRPTVPGTVRLTGAPGGAAVPPGVRKSRS